MRRLVLIAVTMVRDEMPLLPLTLASLLNQGIDRILIVDHKSTDGTREWLHTAQRADERLVVIDHANAAQYQSAVISTLARRAVSLGATWVLPFDADEFWVAADPSARVVDVLKDMDARGLDAVSVAPRNFAAPVDCEEFRLSELARVNHRCKISAGGYDNLAEFMAGTRAFIAYEWPAKWIVKAHPHMQIAAGAHSVPSLTDHAIVEAFDEIHCLHLPLRSKQFIHTKRAQGIVLRDSGYARWHAWQNQMLIDLESDGDVRRVWEANSCSSNGRFAAAASSDILIPDFSLSDIYAALSDHPLLQVTPSTDARYVTHSGDDAASDWLGIAESFAHEAECLRAENAARLNELEQERAQRLVMQQRLEEVQAGTARERTQLLLSQNELERARADLAQVVQSRSWRYTALVRTGLQRVRKRSPEG